MDFDNHDYAESLNKPLRGMVKMALSCGASEMGMNPNNALKFIEKRLRFLDWIEQEFLEMGYTSTKTAIKSIKQFKSPENHDISHLPEEFQKVPSRWLIGRKAVPSRGIRGAAPMGPREAELKHKQCMPWLLEAWAFACSDAGGEEIMDNIQTKYFSLTADEFMSYCYMLIHDIDESSLEDEFASRRLVSSDFEASATLKELRNDYGAGGVMEEVTWDDE